MNNTVRRYTMGRDIALFIDGTWCDQTDEYVTNILKMHRCTSRDVTSLYYRGLGNEFDNDGFFGTIRHLIRGAFGSGAQGKMMQVYDGLCAAWRPGDRIYIFGFSRGAAIARMLAAYIYKRGINGVAGFSIPITFLGCFDTVASFGIPGNHVNLFKDFDIPLMVVNARHAIAKDEMRSAFPITLMNQRAGVEERWFKGDHCDIGGGHADSGLSNATLQWMMTESEDQGLKFKPGWWKGIETSPKESGTSEGMFQTPRIPGELHDDVFEPF